MNKSFLFLAVLMLTQNVLALAPFAIRMNNPHAVVSDKIDVVFYRGDFVGSTNINQLECINLGAFDKTDKDNWVVATEYLKTKNENGVTSEVLNPEQKIYRDISAKSEKKLVGLAEVDIYSGPIYLSNKSRIAKYLNDSNLVKICGLSQVYLYDESDVKKNQDTLNRIQKLEIKVNSPIVEDDVLADKISFLIQHNPSVIKQIKNLINEKK